MKVGLMARHVQRATLSGTLDACAGYGIRHVQYSLDAPAGSDLPDSISDSECATIRETFAQQHVQLSALSGTFNMIDPSIERRRAGVERFKRLMPACRKMGVDLVTLCTGTRDPSSMWRRHPDNDSEAAWSDLLATTAEAVHAAEEAGVTLCIEPEVSNVIDSAAKARRLMDAMQSNRLKVVMDGANLFHAGELARMTEILDEAFDLVGPDVVLAHAKDLTHDGEAGNVAAGTGMLDYDRYLGLLDKIGYDGPVILHSLSESQVPGCVKFLNQKLAEL